ncbi:MAG TPA: adenylate/guanylate cyclase domain-containing protein [Gaiellaceae bacterium]|nr:adenylate/guanylate cyclase domain-containing protein [Gaiellaceae bacterium]
MALARTQYVRSGDVDIAYQVIGDGPRTILLSFDWASHLEALPEFPAMADFIRSLARFAKVVWFDMRGIGLSGSAAGGVVPVEAWMDDLVAVMDVAGVSEAALVAQGHAVQMALMAAATHPDRVEALVLYNGYARFARDDDYPMGIPASAEETLLDGIESQWGSGTMALVLAPTFAARPGVQEWWGRVERYGATPGLARAKKRSILDTDVRDVLPLIRVPTLIVHSRDNEYVRVGHGRYLAEHIPGARLSERDSPDHWLVPDLVGEIEEFLTGSRSGRRDDERVLATVLFVDVVESTRYASELGDESWRIAVECFEAAARTALEAYGGVYDHSTGDGLLATFDGPARAIRCALHLRDEVRRSGLEVRTGLHTGEITRTTEGVAGLAVHIGARVSALAEPREVLVTRTVRDLVAGSGIVFEERGEHELKGVPDSWALYAVVG